MKRITIAALLSAIILLFTGCGRVWNEPPAPLEPEIPGIPASRTRGIEIDTSLDHIVWDSETVENMTDAQLRGLAYTQPKVIIPDFFMPDLFSVPFLEDPDNPSLPELWLDLSWRSGSFDSKESAIDEAIAVVMSQPEQESLTYTCEFIGENDYYYQYRLHYIIERPDAPPLIYTHRMIFYKDSAVTLEGRPIQGETIIHDTNAENVMNLLDLFLYFRTHAFGGNTRLIHREFHETENEFQYVFYWIRIIGGTGGIHDNVSLIRTVWAVDKTFGSARQTEEIVLKETHGILGQGGLAQ